MGPCQSSNAGGQQEQTSSTTTRPTNNTNPSNSKGNNSSSKKSTKSAAETNNNNSKKTSSSDVAKSKTKKGVSSRSGSSSSSKDKNNKPRIVRSKKGKIAKSAAIQRRRRPSSSTSTTKKKKNKNTTQQQQQQQQQRQQQQQSHHPADKSKWICTEHHFNGDYMGQEIGEEEEVKGKSIKEGVQKFKSNPSKYVAMMYQTSSYDWSPKDQGYTLIHRDGTIGFKPTLLDPKNKKKGWMTLLLYQYQTLEPFPKNLLPFGSKFKDKYTDNFVWKKRKIHNNNKNLPILPGRGMGIGDTPDLKIIGDVDPSDIHQGYVDDCWLLSGISSLAEFDGAIKRLFRKTKNLYNMPTDQPNMYTITLWDLQTWKEVDIVIDERLCSKPGPSSTGGIELLGAKPSEDGELWVCYLEKALAAHCGGWDKISGGQCTHAWALLTGCREQYTIRRIADPKKSNKYGCFAKYNTTDKCWAKHCNSPHDGDKRMWRSAWPKVGGGGNANLELTQEELFMRMCAWDDTNYIIGAGIRKSGAAGLVDDHAYSVIECLNDVAGTPIDLIKVRNPWGKGEIEDGEFDDDGPGWDKWPQIKAELNPVVADDGIFWVTKQEFFEFFGTIFLSASNMTEFLED